MSGRRLMLVGGGHSHVEVLRRFAMSSGSSLATTLITPDAASIYSGMLPGVIAGHYAMHEAQIALAPLADAAGAQLVIDRVIALDLHARTARLASRGVMPFDMLSLDIGSTPDTTTPGARDHAIVARPFEQLISAWEKTLQDAAGGSVRSLAVVGGGAGGVELLLAMHYRLRHLQERAPRCMLITDRPALLPEHTPSVGRRLARILEQRGMALHLATPALAVERAAIRTPRGGRIEADRIVWTTQASAAPWLRSSGLACDERGFVRVNAHLQSTTHPFVFASGDCASQEGHVYPKSGLYAVRHGPVLTENLRRAASGATLASFDPPRRSLALIGTGDKRAVLSYGPLSAEGVWVWAWKQRIDRRHVAKYGAEALAAGIRTAGD